MIIMLFIFFTFFTDPMYQGIYHGKSCHPPDLDNVLKRSYEGGVDKVYIYTHMLCNYM